MRQSRIKKYNTQQALNTLNNLPKSLLENKQGKLFIEAFESIAGVKQDQRITTKEE